MYHNNKKYNKHIKPNALNKLMSTTIKTFSITSLLFLMQSCANSNTFTLDERNFMNQKSSKQVLVLGNKSDADNLKVFNFHSMKSDAKFTAQASIFNTNRSKTSQLYYRCKFYNEALFEEPDQYQTWVPLQIAAREFVDVKCSSYNPRVVTFKLQLSSGGNALNTNR